MSDDLEEQLAAYGRTLEAATGERVRPTVASTSDSPHSVSRRSVWGAAAAVVLLIVGLTSLVRSRNTDEVSSPSDTIDIGPSALAVDWADPLGLSGGRWELATRTIGEYGVIDVTSCAEAKELEALSGETVVNDTYLDAGGGDPFLDVIFVDYGEAQLARERIKPVTEVQDCRPGLDADPLDVADSARVTGEGYRLGSSAQLTFVGDDGRAMLVLIANEDDPAVVDELSRRAIAVLEAVEDPFSDAELTASAPLRDFFATCSDESFVLTTWDPEMAPLRDSAEDAFRDAYMAMVAHADEAGHAPPPERGWATVYGLDLRGFTYVYANSAGTRAVIRVEPVDGQWRPTEAAECLPGVAATADVEPVPVETAAPTTTAAPTLDELTVTTAAPLGQAQTEPEVGEVRLWVSNQSFVDDPIQLTISIDGQAIVDDAFEVESQHNWIPYDIAGLVAGPHSIRAVSNTGVALDSTFTLPEGEPRWLVLDYWYHPDEPQGRYFTLNESDDPVRFS